MNCHKICKWSIYAVSFCTIIEHIINAKNKEQSQNSSVNVWKSAKLVVENQQNKNAKWVGIVPMIQIIDCDTAL